METKRIVLDLDREQTSNPDHYTQENEWKEWLIEAATLLQQGEVVAFPTETVYGLGANALNPAACVKIFAVKGRPADNPLIVHVAEIDEAKRIVREWPHKAELCARKFWPGPLTLVLPKKEIISDLVSGGLDTVAVRIPAHPVALALIKAAGVPLAAPSANISGKPSPTEGKHVWQDLKGKIPLLIDAGKSKVGLESTVLDLSGEVPTILRPGGVTLEQLAEVLGRVDLTSGINGELPVTSRPKSPGMKYKHYAPEGELILLNGSTAGNAEEIIKALATKDKRRKYALICMRETASYLGEEILNQAELVFILGSLQNLTEAASRLFEGLRFCDEQEIDTILAEGMAADGIGLAFMNRIRKAAGNQNLADKALPKSRI